MGIVHFFASQEAPDALRANSYLGCRQGMQPAQAREGRMLAQVRFNGLGGMSYVGMLRLEGCARSAQGSEFLLYGRRCGSHDTTQICLSPSPKRFCSQGMACALQGESGAHNLCIIDDDHTHNQVADLIGACDERFAYAVGGQYRQPGAGPRRVGCDGIYLYTLRRNQHGCKAQ